MKQISFIGIILIIIGIVVLAYEGITCRTHGKANDISRLQLIAEKRQSISWPPILGGVAFFSGIVLIIIGTKQP
jgi:dipeptide/tripeptide permease